MSAQVTLMGRVGGEVELRFTPSGKPVASFSMVTDRREKQGEQWVSVDTTWWKVSCWNQLAENVAEKLRKGDAVIVSGRACMREWEGRDGAKGKSLEVTAWNVGKDLKWGESVTREPKSDPWNPPSKREEPPF